MDNKLILKVQIPIMSSDPNPDAMIYNEDRSILTLVPTEAVKSYFKPQQYKVFVFGEMKGTLLHLGELAPEQDW